MKRCPKCEFIYEDDQSLCDMDGALLVLDSRTLPNLHALQTVEAKPATKRNRTVPAFATLILALVLGLVYYVSTQRSVVVNADSSIPAVAIPNLAPEPAIPVLAVLPLPREEAYPATSKTPAATPAKKLAVKTALVQTKTSTPTQKKDESKVGSILKKTGRILKKPFKF